jgi:hypothetical protein
MVTFPKQHYYELAERAIIRLGHRRPTPFSASIDAKRRVQLARFQKEGYLTPLPTHYDVAKAREHARGISIKRYAPA